MHKENTMKCALYYFYTLFYSMFLKQKKLKEQPFVKECFYVRI